MPAEPRMPEFATEAAHEFDRPELERVANAFTAAVHHVFPIPAAPPPSVDLAPHLRYIRDQNQAGGCFLYSLLAMWDIMNDIACPNSPTLSSRIGLLFHSRCRPQAPASDPFRNWWLNESNGKRWYQDGIFTPDGRFHPLTVGGWGEAVLEEGFYQHFGNTTEGTEITAREYPVDWPIGPTDKPWLWSSLWTEEGVNEASNYRLGLTRDPSTGSMEPKLLPVEVSSQSFMSALAQGRPIRVAWNRTNWGHFVAIVGYHQTSGTFSYVNSWGDKWGSGGFGTFSFSDIDKKAISPADPSPFAGCTLTAAQTIEIRPPKPVPVARIAFTHTNRSNVHLWLFAENSWHQRSKIWPQHWRENCSDLRYTVRVPSEFVWPPTDGNRLVLELYDSAQYTGSGGQLVEFSAAFGDDVLDCPTLSNGPKSFQPRERLQFVIP